VLSSRREAAHVRASGKQDQRKSFDRSKVERKGSQLGPNFWQCAKYDTKHVTKYIRQISAAVYLMMMQVRQGCQNWIFNSSKAIQPEIPQNLD
jgi:hypothetical protein